MDTIYDLTLKHLYLRSPLLLLHLQKNGIGGSNNSNRFEDICTHQTIVLYVPNFNVFNRYTKNYIDKLVIPEIYKLPRIVIKYIGELPT